MGMLAHAAVKLAPSALGDSATFSPVLTDSSIKDRADLRESTSFASTIMTSITMRSERL